jgi:YggT family protein
MQPCIRHMAGGAERATGAGLRRSTEACTVRPRYSCPDRFSMTCATLGVIVDVLFYVLEIYKWILIASAILSWLLAFGVINRYNRAVVQIADMLYRLTEPTLRPIRRIVPFVNGIDISYLVMFVLIFLVERVLISVVANACY